MTPGERKAEAGKAILLLLDAAKLLRKGHFPRLARSAISLAEETVVVMANCKETGIAKALLKKGNEV